MKDYEWLTMMGLCHKCRKQKCAPEKKYCFECLEKIREDNRKRYNSEKAKEYNRRRREIYKKKRNEGICVRCSRNATHGLHCYECSIRVKRASILRAEIRKNERHERGLIPERRKEEGKCLWCGKTAVLGLLCCEEHRKIFSDAGKKAYEANLRNGNNSWINEVEKWKKRNGWKRSENG